MPKIPRKQYVVDTSLQFWFTIIIILIVSTESIFVGWGMAHLSKVASDWQRTEIVMDFFRTFGLILLLLIGGNFILGVYFSHKVAGPLFKLRNALRGMRQGRLFHIQLRRGDMLKDFIKEFNETIIILHKLFHRDQKILHMGWENAEKCIELLQGKPSEEDLLKAVKMLKELKSYLTSINSHFLASNNILNLEESNAEKQNNTNN